MSESLLEEVAARQLEEVGFFVQRDVRVSTVGSREARIDIVAWTGSDTGDLTPDLIVEVKRLKDDAQRASAARQFRYYVPLVDAMRAYIFDGSWYRVSDDCETPVPAACPRPDVPSEGAVAPQSVIAELIEREFDKLRTTAAGPEERWRQLLDQLTSERPVAADNAAAIDRILGSLREGGRAALLVQPSLLFAGGATEEFRAWRSKRGLSQSSSYLRGS